MDRKLKEMAIEKSLNPQDIEKSKIFHASNDSESFDCSGQGIEQEFDSPEMETNILTRIKNIVVKERKEI